MRKCLRCGEEMEEGYALGGAGGNTIRRKGLTGKAAYPNAAVCANCGEVSLYLEGEKLDKVVD